MTSDFQTLSGNEDPVLKLLTDIVRALVDDADSVRVDAFRNADIITLNLYVAPSDTGKIIGKQGRMARSLRTLLSAAGMKCRRRYALNIEEENLPSSYSE